MKKYGVISNVRLQISVICLLFFSITFSQTYENEPETDNVNGEEIVIDSDNVSPEVLSNLGFDTSFAPNPEEIVGNLVTIQQIGDFNRANIFTATQSSDINITQEGNSNEVDLSYTALSVFTQLNQQGNFNFVTDFVADENATPALDLTQDGNNLSFERYGVNSLTNSLRFTQTEASPTIIVRSYQ